MNKGLIVILPVFLYTTVAWSAPPLPDPTRPPDYAVNAQIHDETTEPVTEFNLTAIRIDRDDRSAIINGQLVRAGNMVGLARVLEIHPAEVVLSIDQRRQVVRLYDRLVKTERKSNAGVKTLN